MGRLVSDFDSLVEIVMEAIGRNCNVCSRLRPRLVGREHPRRLMARFNAPGVIHICSWTMLA